MEDIKFGVLLILIGLGTLLLLVKIKVIEKNCR